MKSKVTKDFTKFNKKIKNLKKKAKIFEVGLFEPEQARKGLLLEHGDKGQVSRPWFSNTMSPHNEELIELMEDSGQRYIEGDLPESRLGKHLVSICKKGVNDPSLEELKEYTIKVKQGIIPRPSGPEKGERIESRGKASQIGIDSGEMIDSIDYKTRKR